MRPPEPTVLRLVTWNVHHGVGQDGRLDTDRIAGHLAALAPDVVALQEVDRGFHARSAWADQPAELAAALGMGLLRGPALRRPPRVPGAVEGEYGVALLTRAPARLVALQPLVVPGREPRVLLRAEVAVIGGRPLTVLVTHLDPGPARVRREQAAAIAGPGRGPAVLLGDLNARPGAPELSPLGDWTDAWVAAPERSGGSWPLGDGVAARLPATWLRRHLVGRTHPARFPVRRIDAVLVRGGVDPLRATVVDVPGSDHRPLAVDVAVPLSGPLAGPPA